MCFDYVAEGKMISLLDVVLLYGVGVSCGLVLSVFPLVFGELINFGLSIFKKGG